MSQILFDLLARNDNASIVLVNNVIIASVKVIIGSHIFELKFAERPVTNSVSRNTSREGGGAGEGCL